MAKMHGHYFGRGRKIMTRYFRRNASGLLLYFAYSIARIVGDVLLILLPVFATSSFNSAHMLKETGDLYLSKSFDHAEDEKSYRSLLLFAAVVVLGAGALIAGLIFLNEYIRFILFLAILNPDSASIFYWMTFAVNYSSSTSKSRSTTPFGLSSIRLLGSSSLTSPADLKASSLSSSQSSVTLNFSS